MNLNPLTQINLFEHKEVFNQLYKLSKNDTLPNKILLSGEKGIGKSTLAYHLINLVLSENEEHPYDFENNKINPDNKSYKLILNKSNPNFYLIDVLEEKKNIDINQIRELIINLNKSSFNNKKRFVLIDNIELLNINSINALLKILEEPNENINFILIHNNRKILSTLLSRCINFKISLSNNDYLKISNQLLNNDLNNLVSNELINYYFTPGEIYQLVQFSSENDYDLSNIDLKNFLKILINDTQYKKNNFINNMMYSLMEFYFRKSNQSFSKLLNEKYSYFIKRISDTKTYNLDKESLFMEFNEEILDAY